VFFYRCGVNLVLWSNRCLQAATGGFQSGQSGRNAVSREQRLVHLELCDGSGPTFQRWVTASSKRLSITQTRAMQDVSGSDEQLQKRNWDAARDLGKGRSVTLGRWKMLSCTCSGECQMKPTKISLPM
jgi:hypothetical protein